MGHRQSYRLLLSALWPAADHLNGKNGHQNLPIPVYHWHQLVPFLALPPAPEKSRSPAHYLPDPTFVHLISSQRPLITSNSTLPKLAVDFTGPSHPVLCETQSSIAIPNGERAFSAFDDVDFGTFVIRAIGKMWERDRTPITTYTGRTVTITEKCLPCFDLLKRRCRFDFHR